MEQPVRIQAGTTRLFTVVYSTQPTSAAILATYVGSPATMISSVMGTSAGVATFQANVTFPVGSYGTYAYEWTAQFSAGLDYTRGLFRVIRTVPWAHY